MKFRPPTYLTAILFGLCALIEARADGGRIAMVVGNGEYHTGALRSAVNDAEAIAAGLARLGFQVHLIEDANLQELLEAVRSFRNRVADGVSMALFYFAGHGAQVEGRNFLIPVGSNIQSEDDIEFFGLDPSLILSEMVRAGPQTNVVILDACRAGPFSFRTQSATGGLAAMMAPPGSIVVYSAAPGTIAPDRDLHRGVFAEALLRHMNASNVDIEAILRRVTLDVVNTTSGAQTPWSSSSLTAEAASTGSRAPAQQPAPPVPALPMGEPSIDTATTEQTPRTIALLLTVGNGSIGSAGVSWAVIPDRVFLNSTVGASYWAYEEYSANRIDGLLAVGDIELRWHWFKRFFTPFLGAGLFVTTDFGDLALSGHLAAGIALGSYYLRAAAMSGAVTHASSSPEVKFGIGVRL